eukprot:gb/GECG01002486.1/.p1 GENE.gb/GECG01002486.1/~~gb/GECG01002486.1/.p1  ORF type:complete len:3166 (+),score=386.87 gb/GECG01002486.1/:1-9498(+)
MEALVASIKKRKDFKRLAVYSIEALVKTAAPPASGWLENARTAHSLGVLPALEDVLERYPDDVDLFHGAIRQINAIVLAGKTQEVFEELSNDHSKITKATDAFFKEYIHRQSPGSIPQEEWQTRRDILEQLASMVTQCATTHAAHPDCYKLAEVTRKLLPEVKPQDAADATHFEGLSTATFHSPLVVRLLFQGMEVVTRTKAGLQQCTFARAVMGLVHACQLYTDGSTRDNFHIRYAFRVMDRLSRDEQGLQRLRDIRAVAAMAPAVEFAQRWKSVGSYGVKILARVLGENLLSLLVNICGINLDGSSITEREAEFAASLGSSLALEESVCSRFTEEADLRDKIVSLPSEAANAKAAVSVMQMIRRILRNSRIGASVLAKGGLTARVISLLYIHRSDSNSPLIVAESIGCIADILQRVPLDTVGSLKVSGTEDWIDHIILTELPSVFKSHASVVAATVEFARTFTMRVASEQLPDVHVISSLLNTANIHEQYNTVIYYASELIVEYIYRLQHSERKKDVGDACAAFRDTGSIYCLVNLLKYTADTKQDTADNRRSVALSSRSFGQSFHDVMDGAHRPTFSRNSQKVEDDIVEDVREEILELSIDLLEDVDCASLAASPMYAISILCDDNESAQQEAKSHGFIHGIVNAYTSFVESATNTGESEIVFGAFLTAVNALVRKNDISGAVRGMYSTCTALQELAGRADLFDMSVKEIINDGLTINTDVSDAKLPEDVSADDASEVAKLATEYACLLEVIAASPPHAYLLSHYSGIGVLIRFVAMLSNIKGVAENNQKQQKGKLAWNPLANKSAADSKKLPETLQEDLLQRCCKTLEKLAHLAQSTHNDGGSLDGSLHRTVSLADEKTKQSKMALVSRLESGIVADIMKYGSHLESSSVPSSVRKNLGELEELPQLLEMIARSICYSTLPKMVSKGTSSLVHLISSAVAGCSFLGTFSCLSHPRRMIGVTIECGSVEACTAVIRRASSKYFWAVGLVAKGLRKIGSCGDTGAEAVVTRGATRQLIRELRQEKGDDKQGSKRDEFSRSWDSIEELCGLSDILSVFDAVADVQKSADILKKQGAVDALIMTLDAVSDSLGKESETADVSSVMGKPALNDMESSRNLLGGAAGTETEEFSNDDQGDTKELSVLRNRVRSEIISVLTKLMDSSSVHESLKIIQKTEKAIRMKGCSAAQSQMCHLALTTLSAMCGTEKGKSAGSDVWCEVVDACSQLSVSAAKIGKSNKHYMLVSGFQDSGLSVSAEVTDWITEHPYSCRKNPNVPSLLVEKQRRSTVVHDLLSKVTKMLQSPSKLMYVTSEARLEAMHCLCVIPCEQGIGERVLRDKTYLDCITQEAKSQVEVWDSISTYYASLCLRNFASLAQNLQDSSIAANLVERGWLSLSEEISRTCLEYLESTANMQIRGRIGESLAYALETIAILSGERCEEQIQTTLKEATNNIGLFTELDSGELVPSLFASLTEVCTLCHMNDPRGNSKIGEKLLDALSSGHMYDAEDIMGCEKTAVAVFDLVNTLCARKGGTAQITASKENRQALRRMGTKELIVSTISHRNATNAVVSAGSKALTTLEGDVQGQYGFAALLREQLYELALGWHNEEPQVNGPPTGDRKPSSKVDKVKDAAKRLSAAVVSVKTMYTTIWMFSMNAVVDVTGAVLHQLLSGNKSLVQRSDLYEILGISLQSVGKLLSTQVVMGSKDEVSTSTQFNSFIGTDTSVVTELASKGKQAFSNAPFNDCSYSHFVPDPDFEAEPTSVELEFDPLMDTVNGCCKLCMALAGSHTETDTTHCEMLLESSYKSIQASLSRTSVQFKLDIPTRLESIVKGGILSNFMALGIRFSSGASQETFARGTESCFNVVSAIVDKACRETGSPSVVDPRFLLPGALFACCGFSRLCSVDRTDVDLLAFLWDALMDPSSTLHRTLASVYNMNVSEESKISAYYTLVMNQDMISCMLELTALLNTVYEQSVTPFHTLSEMIKLALLFFHSCKISGGPELKYDLVMFDLLPELESELRTSMVAYAGDQRSNYSIKESPDCRLHLLAYIASHGSFKPVKGVIDCQETANILKKCLNKESKDLFSSQKSSVEFANADTCVWLVELLRRECLLGESVSGATSNPQSKQKSELLASFGVFQALSMSLHTKAENHEYTCEVFRLLYDVAKTSALVLGGDKDSLTDGINLLKLDHRSYAMLQAALNHHTEEDDDLKLTQYAAPLLASMEEIFEEYSAWGFLKALKAFLAAAEENRASCDDTSEAILREKADILTTMCERVDADVIPSVPEDVLRRYHDVFANELLQENINVATATAITAARLVDNARNVGYLVDVGAVKTAFRVVYKHRDSVQISDYIITFLRPFSLKQEHVALLKAREHVTCLTELADKYYNVETRVAWMVQDKDDKDDDDGLPETSAPYYPRIAHHCVQLFANIACDTPELDENGNAVEGSEQSGVEIILELEGVSAIRKIMEAQINQPRILEDSLCALSNMAYTTDEARLLIGRECGNVIVQSLQVFHEDPFLFSMALRAIGNLTRIDTNIISIMQHSIGKPICAGMMANINNPDVLQIACDVLGNLVSVEEEGLDRDDAIETLRNGIKSIKKDPAKQEASLHKLGLRILPTPVLDATIAPSHDPKDFDFQAVVAEWLLVDGAAETCIRVLKQHYTNPEVVGSALRALQYFGEVDEILRTVTMELNYPSTLALVLRSCDFDSTVCERGVYAWAQHLRLEDEIREKAFEANAHYILLSILETHQDDASVSDITLRVVAMATIDENSKQTIMAAKEMNSHKAVLRILQNTDDEDLKLHAIVLLSKWSEDRSVVKRMALDTLRACKDLIFSEGTELQVQTLFLIESLLQFRKIVDVSVHIGIIESVSKFAVCNIFEVPGEVIEVLSQIVQRLTQGKADTAASALRKGAEALCDTLSLISAVRNDTVTYNSVGKAYLKLLGLKARCQSAVEAEEEEMKLNQATAAAKAAAAAQASLEADSDSETSSDEESFEVTNNAATQAISNDQYLSQDRPRPGILPLERFPLKVLQLLLKGVNVPIWFLPYMHKKGKLKRRTMMLALSEHYDVLTFYYHSNKLKRDLQWKVFLSEVVNVRVGLPLHKMRKRLFRKTPDRTRSVCLDTVEGTCLHTELPSTEDAEIFRICIILLTAFAKARAKFSAPSR